MRRLWRVVPCPSDATSVVLTRQLLYSAQLWFRDRTRWLLAAVRNRPDVWHGDPHSLSPSPSLSLVPRPHPTGLAARKRSRALVRSGAEARQQEAHHKPISSTHASIGTDPAVHRSASGTADGGKAGAEPADCCVSNAQGAVCHHRPPNGHLSVQAPLPRRAPPSPSNQAQIAERNLQLPSRRTIGYSSLGPQPATCLPAMRNPSQTGTRPEHLVVFASADARCMYSTEYMTSLRCPRLWGDGRAAPREEPHICARRVKASIDSRRVPTSPAARWCWLAVISSGRGHGSLWRPSLSGLWKA